jgi:ribonuclease BN (tRNA processing enzyme)
MRLTVLGSSGTFPVPGRPASGFLIEHESTRIWCDAGPGTLMALPIALDMVDAIVISHQHPDHCADVFAAFHSWAYRPEPRVGVPLYGPQSVIERLSKFLDKWQGSNLYETFEFTPVWTGDSVTFGDVEVRFTEMDHSVPTVGSRWEVNNHSLFYTGDTGASGDWRGLAEGVNVMLAEATYQGESGVNPYPHHLTAGEAGSIAREAGAKRLVLTHIPPYLDPTISVKEAETAFDRPVTLAVPGGVIDV